MNDNPTSEFAGDAVPEMEHADVGALNASPANSASAEAPSNTHQVRQKMARQAKELGETAQELQQLAMFQEHPFEEVFLYPPEQVAKRYTAQQANKIEMRRRACIYMHARQCPAEDIADILQMNLRTIQAIVSQGASERASFSEKFAQELMNSAAADLAHAETMRTQASYKDLHIAAGIKMTHGEALKAMSGMGDEQPVIDVESENPELKKAREFIANMKKANPTTEEKAA